MKRLLLTIAIVLWLPILLWGFSLLGRPYWRQRVVQERLTQFSQHYSAAWLNSILREGDLIFHTSRSAQSQAIQLATHSPYSHCGILYRQGGQWQVFEAVQPVRLTPLATWVARGTGGRFVVKRLRDADLTLTPAALAGLRAAGQPLLGRPYDLAFNWSDQQIYCSELIWKVYDRGLNRQLGHLQRLRDFNLSHPAVQAKLRERYGNRVPLDEPVISPAAVFGSPELRTVVAH